FASLLYLMLGRHLVARDRRVAPERCGPDHSNETLMREDFNSWLRAAHKGYPSTTQWRTKIRKRNIHGLEDTVELTARAILLVILSMCPASVLADTAKEAWNKCAKANDTETKLRECSVAIEAGTLSKDFVAYALLFRASAYDERDDYDHAIQDLDESIRLNPSSS